MSLDSATWPERPIPEAVKDLLKKFYACVDSPQDPNANVVLADEVFHSDATFTINNRVIEGRDAIVNWRSGAASRNGVKVRAFRGIDTLLLTWLTAMADLHSCGAESVQLGWQGWRSPDHRDTLSGDDERE